MSSANVTAAAKPEEGGQLNAFLSRLNRDVHARDLRTGSWYTKVLGAYVEYYAQRHKHLELSAVPGDERAAIADKLIERTALWTAIAGTTAAVGVTAASVAMAQTAFLAAPVVLPLAGLGVAGELFLRAVLHLQLTCELAELYGMPFHPGSEMELVRVSALALRAEMHETEDDPGRGLVERISRTQQTGTLGKLIASGLVGESLLRNAIPFADVAVSSVRNWQLARQVGHFVQGYASRRVALDEAVKLLAEQSPDSVEPLLEGIWFIFISDGRLTGIETALLAYLMRERQTSSSLTEHFVSDEAAWLEHLRKIAGSPASTTFVRALEVAAAVEKPTTRAELTILKRAAETLGVELTTQETAAKLDEIAASSAVAGEHDDFAVPREHARVWAQQARERAHAWTRATTLWCSRTLHQLRSRPHVQTVTLNAS
ncbi:MAG: hypothetical protein RL701_4095 [Pseudomonadota bacterium]